MNLKVALELGRECGLLDVGDCILNIKMRVGQLFETEEYYDLVENYNRCKDEHGINLETKIEDCLTIINESRLTN